VTRGDNMGNKKPQHKFRKKIPIVPTGLSEITAKINVDTQVATMKLL
jgi:hypothetical protein